MRLGLLKSGLLIQQKPVDTAMGPVAVPAWRRIHATTPHLKEQKIIAAQADAAASDGASTAAAL